MEAIGIIVLAIIGLWIAGGSMMHVFWPKDEPLPTMKEELGASGLVTGCGFVLFLLVVAAAFAVRMV